MAIKRRTRVKAEFSMASLTDIIFLLLIFFMLTSSFVTPNALKLLLPKASNKVIPKENINVSITPDLEFFVGTRKVPESRLEEVLREEVDRVQRDDPTININADKSVPWEYMVKVMVVAKKLNARVIAATEPD